MREGGRGGRREGGAETHLLVLEILIFKNDIL
jgi:hypothetical protein